MMMRDALQELRSGKRFFAARRRDQGALAIGARRSAVYGDARAGARLGPALGERAYGRPGRRQLLLRRFSVQSPPKRNRGLVLETSPAEICETADGASDQCF